MEWEDENGEWVKYSDHAAREAALQAEGAAAIVMVRECHDLIESRGTLDDMIVRGEKLLVLMKAFLADQKPAGAAPS
jgi:hypothetical protein